MVVRKLGTTLLFALIPVALVFVAFIVLLQTALFQLNPLKIGFKRSDFQDCTVFFKDTAGSFDYAKVHAIMEQNEAVHGMHYKSKVQVIICSRQSDVDKYLPLLDPTDRRTAGSFAEWPNTVYITPKGQQKYGASPGPVAHELSHILLIQNFGVLKIALLQRSHEWIPEGFATYLCNFPDYFPPDRLKAEATAAGIDMVNGRLFGSKSDSDFPFRVRFMVYRGFVAYLFRTNPPTTVIQFLKEACEKPTVVGSVFQENFKKSFENCVKEFWQTS